MMMKSRKNRTPPAAAKPENRSVRHATRRPILWGELLWLDDAQSSYLSKVPFVERGYLASAPQSRCANNEVIEADHFAGSLQFRPNARMFISGLLCIRDNRHRLQDRPQITFTRGPVLSGRPLYSVPELSNGDRGNLKLVIGTGSHHFCRSKVPFSPRMMTSASRII